MRGATITVVLVLIGTLGLAAPVAAVDPAASRQTTLSFGVVTQQLATKLARLWAPVLNYLHDKTGINLRFETARNIPTFEERLRAGAYDLACMNPYQYVAFHDAPGYRAMGQMGMFIIPKYVGSHDFVHRAVARVLFPAGGGIPNLEQYGPERA